MQQDILACKELGVSGVVLGMLNSDGTVDVLRTRKLVELAHPMAVTFHRAFDMTKDPYKSLSDICLIKGINRILTSGQSKSCLEGLNLLKELQIQASGRLVIMPGGGLRRENVDYIIEQLDPSDIHMSCSIFLDSKMEFKNPKVSMGGADNSFEFKSRSVDGDLIKKIAQNKET
jgi:copper homeostasis protein